MDNNRFKLATISISPQAGAEFGITGALTYTSVLHTIKDIPIDPVSDQIEKPAAWCANENGICECDGFVRYGFGENGTSWKQLLTVKSVATITNLGTLLSDNAR